MFGKDKNQDNGGDGNSQENGGNGKNPPPEPEEKNTGKVVQLASNQAGHQAGETFKIADANKLGILKHCKPFKP